MELRKFMKHLFFLIIIFLILAITLTVAFALPKDKFCSAWENITFSECDMLYDYFTSNTSSVYNSDNVTLVYYNFTLPQQEVIIINNNTRTDAEIREIIEPYLETYRVYVLNEMEDRLQEYKEKRDTELVGELRRQIDKYEGKNLTFQIVQNANKDELGYLSEDEILTLIGKEMPINQAGTTPAKKQDNTVLYIIGGFIALIAGFSYYKKKRDDEKASNELRQVIMKEEQSRYMKQPLAVDRAEIPEPVQSTQDKDFKPRWEG